MRILFLHGWTSVTGGVKPTFLKDHGHTVFNPKLPEEAVQIAQDEFDKHKPHVVVGSSRGGAVAMNIKSRRCPARRALPGVESVGIGEDGEARHGDPAFTGRRRDPFRRLRGTGPLQRASSVGFDRGRKGVTDWPTRSRWERC